MTNQFLRTQMLLGKDNMAMLASSKVAVFGVGGVGSYVCEALARSGVGELTLFDHDVVEETNINRQIHAGYDTIGMHKTEAMIRRIRNINPTANLTAVNEFILGNNIEEHFMPWDYVVDAVDTVTAKILIVENSIVLNVPVISCMGTGNKLHPEMLEIADIYDTQVCPLAKVMRKEMKKRDVKALKVCFSKENPIEPRFEECGFIKTEATRKMPPGSVSFVPAAAGLLIAGEVVRALTNTR